MSARVKPAVVRAVKQHFFAILCGAPSPSRHIWLSQALRFLRSQ